MDRDKDGGRSAQGTQRQKSKLRWAIDDHDVILRVDRRSRRSNAREKHIVARLEGFREFFRSGMLECVEFEVTRDEVQPIKIGFTNDMTQWAPLSVIPERAIKSFVRADIKLGLKAEQCG